MSQKPDFLVDPDGNVRDVRDQIYSHDSDSPPPSQSPVTYVSNTPSKKNQAGGGVILIPIGLILTLIYALVRGCGTDETNPYSDSYNSGMRRYAQGDYEWALIDFNSAISSDPKFAEAYNGRGLVYKAQGDNELALTDFNKAIELQPDSPLPYNNRACVFIEQGEYDRAISDLYQAIQLKPDLAKAYFNRGLVYEVLGDDEAAIADFTNAIQYTPEHRLPTLLSRTPDATSSFSESFEKWEQGMQKMMELESPYADLPTTYLHRGLAYVNQGDTTSAKADLQKALELGLEPADQELAQGILAGLSMLSSGVASPGMALVENPGIQAASIYALTLDPQSPSTLYAGAIGGIFKSTDGGNSWLLSVTGLANAYVTALVIDPSRPETLYAGTTSGFGNSTGGVIKSTDGGQNWMPVNDGLTDLGVYVLAIDPQSPSTLYAGTMGGGVFKSTDSGAKWTASNNGLTDLNILVLAIDHQTPSTLYAGTGVGLFKSIDGGESWNATNLTSSPIRVVAIDPQVSGTVYMGTSFELFKSMDGGVNWVLISADLSYDILRILVIDPQTPSTLYAGSHGLFKSTDAGETWEPFNESLAYSFVLTLAIDPRTPSSLYVGVMDGGVVVIRFLDTGDLLVTPNEPKPNAVYMPQASETPVTPFWDRKQVSCEGKPVNKWGSPGTYLYKSDEGAFLTVVMKPGDESTKLEVFLPGISVLGTGTETVTETVTTGLGTFPAAVFSVSRDYSTLTGRLDYYQGSFHQREWYVCGYGLVKLASSDVGKRSPGIPSSYESNENYVLLSFTPLTTNESRVRYILADIQLGNFADYYHANITDEETAEAVRRWDAGIRVTNIDRFERKQVDGKVLIVYAGTDTFIKAMDFKLSSEPQQ